MDIFYAPFCFRGVRSTFGHYDDIWWWWWLIRERAYDNNIRKILKCFQKQSLWWEHRNILEKLRNHTVLRRDLLKALHSCQNRVVSTVRACHGQTSASWVNNSIRLHTLKRDIFLAQFFSKNFRLFLRIKMMLFFIKLLSHDGWDL